MAKVVCRNPQCGREVPYGRFCMYCQAPLGPRDDEFLGLDAFGFYDRAKSMLQNFKEIMLARLQVLRMPDDGSRLRIKALRVPEGMHMFLYSSAQATPVQLQPGISYTDQELFSRQGLGTSIQRLEDQSWC